MTGINEEIFHPEQAFFRGVNGQSSLFPDQNGRPVIQTLPLKGTIPIAKQLTGTMYNAGAGDLTESTTAVRGTGTLFITEGLSPGDYLYDGDAGVREITDVISETLLFIKTGFAAEVSGVPVRVCKPQWFKRIKVAATGAAEVQETPIAAGQTFITGGSPIAYDGASGELEFSVSK
jgi:hypothetical protein